MPFDDSKWDEIVRQWEEDEPGVADVETPPEGAPEGEMTLPEMDLAPPETPTRLRPEQPAAPLAPPAAKPTVEPKKPLPSPDTLDWKGLGERLSNAQLARGTSQGYESMFANIGAQSGYRPNQHAGQAGVDMAQAPIALAKERQGLERGALQNKAAQADVGAKEAMNDANSLQSQKAREAIKAMGIKLPSGFEGFSAADIQHFVKTGELTRLEESRARAANAAEDDQRKAAAEAQKAAGAAEALTQMRKTWTPELKAAGKDPGTASKFDIEQVMGVVKAREGRAFTANQGDEKDVRDLSGKLGDPAAFNQRYDELMRLVRENGGAVPGLGMIEGMRQQSGAIGSAVRAVSPSSDEAIKGRKLMRQLAADYAREISGAGVSDTERRNLNAATIDVDNDDSRIALAGLQTLKEMHEAKMKQLKRGYKPEVVRRATGGEETPPPSSDDPVVTLTAEDGRVKRVKKSAAEAYLNSHPGGATISE